MPPPKYDNLPTPEEAHDAPALVHRTEQEAYQPTPLRLRSLLATSVFVGLICGGIGAGGLWRFAAVGAFLSAIALWQRRTGVSAIDRRSMPRPLKKAAFLPLVCGCAVVGLALPLIVNALAATPLPWLAEAVAGAALTLVVALTGNWYYRRTYQRWLAESA